MLQSGARRVRLGPGRIRTGRCDGWLRAFAFRAKLRQ